jgi:hypothetical protein
MQFCYLVLTLALLLPLAHAETSQTNLLRSISIYLRGGNVSEFTLGGEGLLESDELLEETLSLIQGAHHHDTSPDMDSRIGNVLPVVVEMAKEVHLSSSSKHYGPIRERAQALLKDLGTESEMQDSLIQIYDHLHLWDKTDFEFLAERAKYPDHLEKFFAPLVKILPYLDNKDKSILVRNLKKMRESSVFQTQLLYSAGGLSSDVKSHEIDVKSYETLFTQVADLFNRAVTQLQKEDSAEDYLPAAVANFLNANLRSLHEELVSGTDPSILEGFEAAIDAAPDLIRKDFLDRIFHNFQERIFEESELRKFTAVYGGSKVISLARFRERDAQAACEARLKTIAKMKATPLR